MGLKVPSLLKRKTVVLLCVAILLYISIFSYLAILKHYAFKSTTWDLGIYEQVLWSTANSGRVFWYTPEIAINPSGSFFGIHFSPFLFLVLPVYAIFQYTETLLILQVVFLALAAVPLYKLVLLERRSHRQALAFASVYLAYPPIFEMIFFDFHVQSFLPFLFFFAFYYFKKEQWGRFLLFVVLSLMVIEFVPLIVVFFGLYGLWVNRRKLSQFVRASNFREFFFDRPVLFSIITIVLGTAWFFIAVSITSTFNPTAPPHPNWKAFGDPVHNLSGVIINVLTNPVKALWIIITPADPKILYVFGLFAPVAFLSFLDLPSLMIGLPWFLVAFLSNYPPYYTPIGYQYVAFVAPFIFVSAIYGFGRLFAARGLVAASARIGGFFGRISKIRHWKGLLAILLVFIVSIAYIAAFGVGVTFPVVTGHDRLLQNFVTLVPSNATILTQNDIFPHLSRRLYGFVGGSSPESLLSSTDLEYILIDASSPWCDDLLSDLIYNLTRNTRFGVQYAADGIWFLNRSYSGETTYLIDNGTFVSFHNQGIVVKLSENGASTGEPSYENVTLSIYGRLGLNIPPSWATKPNFNVTFEGWLYAPVLGEYSFQLESRGFSVLELDDQLVLSNNGSVNHAAKTLDRGFHSIKVCYVKDGDYLPFVLLLWKPPWESSSSMVDILPEFLYPTRSPVIAAPFAGVEFDFASRHPFPLLTAASFSAFTDFSLYAPSSGVYKFQVVSNDDISLSIDGNLVLSPFETLGYGNQTLLEVFLSEGSHEVQIDYVKRQDYAGMGLAWQPPGTSEFRKIPSSNLRWRGN